MDYGNLKREIGEISELAHGVPEQFRDRCFEMLLEHLLSDGQPQDTGDEETKQTPPPDDGDDDDDGDEPIPQTGKLRLLMRTGGFTREDLSEIAMMSDGKVHFIKEPSTNAAATGQAEWALLLVLKNAIEEDRAEVDAEAVRSICQEKGFYDPKNFAGNFKKGKLAGVFKVNLEPQGEPQPLSNDGSKELGELVKTLTNAS